MFKLVSLKLASLFNRRAGLKPCSKNGNQEETSKMEALYLFFCLAVCGGVTLDSHILNMQAGNLFLFFNYFTE